MTRLSWGVFILIFICGFSAFGANSGEFQPDLSIFKDTVVEMTWPEVRKAAENGAVVLFPIGVVEEHGPHLDLSPDIYISCLTCRLIKSELTRKGIPAVIAPPFYWGINQSTGHFPGSFTVQPETMKAVIADTIRCMKNWGFNKFFCFNSHGDSQHKLVLESALADLRHEGIEAYSGYSLSTKVSIKDLPPYPAPRPGKFNPDYHAGADETGLMWAFYPQLVRADVAATLKPQRSFFEPLGYVGDPANYKLEKETAAQSLQVYTQRQALLIEAYLKHLNQ